MYLYLPTAFSPSSPTRLSSILHPPQAQIWAHRGLQEPTALLFPPQGQVCSLPWRAQPVTSTEVFPKDFPPSYSWSGLAGSAEEIWKGNLKRILLEAAGLPVGFGCWRADQHKHVILCYIKSNIPWYSVSSPPHISLFCIIESVLDLWGCSYFSFRPLLKLSVLK